MSKLRVTGPASEISVFSRRCTCCERPLKNQVAWLELDTRTGRYTDDGSIPEERSQGWFPFGLACARTVRK